MTLYLIEKQNISNFRAENCVCPENVFFSVSAANPKMK